MMTRQQADAITVLVCALRSDWDAKGVLAALAEVRDRDPFVVAVAAIRCASVETNKTPAVIALKGAHWTQQGLGQRGAPTQQPPPFCALCKLPHDVQVPCPDLSRRGDYAAGVAAARAALRSPITTEETE